jgi:hypothetical protein
VLRRVLGSSGSIWLLRKPCWEAVIILFQCLSVEKGLTGEIFDKQCELQVIRIYLTPKQIKSIGANLMLASAHLYVWKGFSSLEQLRYNHRAAKQLLAAQD